MIDLKSDLTATQAPKGKGKILSLYGGPGTGKSTTACGVFSELKQLGINCEYVSEYAKDATWERRGAKVFQAQEYIFGKQHFRIARVADEVDIVITDSPILMGIAYTPEGFGMPSLKQTIIEAYRLYENLDIFLERVKEFNPAGRNQNEEEAKALDGTIKGILSETNVGYFLIPADKNVINKVVETVQGIWADQIPKLQEFVPAIRPILTSMRKPEPHVKVLIEGNRIAFYDPSFLNSGHEGWWDYSTGQIDPPKWWLPQIEL